MERRAETCGLIMHTLYIHCLRPVTGTRGNDCTGSLQLILHNMCRNNYMINEFTITTTLTAADVSLTASVAAFNPWKSTTCKWKSQCITFSLLHECSSLHLLAPVQLAAGKDVSETARYCVHSGMLNVLHSTYLLLRPYGWNETRMLLMK